MHSLILGALIISPSSALVARQIVPSTDWNGLRDQVGGRLIPAVPLAAPCFSEGFNSTACEVVKKGYVDELFRSNSTTGYIQTQWESCQTTGQQCLLNFLDPDDPSPVAAPHKCSPGGLPSYFIDVRGVDDVKAAYNFARRTKVPLVIKNTGHDYIGRSSAPGSLALWTHNLKDISYNKSFVPEGCTDAKPGVTMGAGVQWSQAYSFAETHQITLVGGSDRSVGAVGGWLQGGGHSPLSNTMGLGVDRVLQFKVVTPDGEYRVANSCENQDLFFALRGGGGGTFGVVMEATVLADPVKRIQALFLSFKGNDTVTRHVWSILVDNALNWSQDGWGGYSISDAVAFINPVLDKEKAAKSMKPLLEYANKLKGDHNVKDVNVVMMEFPTYNQWFDVFSRQNVAAVGTNLAQASRLIPRETFTTPTSRTQILDALMAARASTPRTLILITAPSSYNSTERIAVNEAWRDTVWHIVTSVSWNWNATINEKRDSYKKAEEAISHIRNITPDAAYFNECDTYEPNFEQSFWGNNYAELLTLKQKYDPDHLLECWRCVGYNPHNPRFSCYLPE
ncbi:FAD-binding domain-containing protein [Pluteus cervinus]|uniref:FAD-binding domain-containing protein n=1 Tax=Pluteus cervinus TaxID=181527 RepID=A0ACD3ANZ6_9AGAR|nr:FAD-binding domain-containing protein [Pluteus cervinus]